MPLFVFSADNWRTSAEASVALRGKCAITGNDNVSFSHADCSETCWRAKALKSYGMRRSSGSSRSVNGSRLRSCYCASFCRTRLGFYRQLYRATRQCHPRRTPARANLRSHGFVLRGTRRPIGWSHVDREDAADPFPANLMRRQLAEPRWREREGNSCRKVCCFDSRRQSNSIGPVFQLFVSCRRESAK